MATNEAIKTYMINSKSMLLLLAVVVLHVCLIRDAMVGGDHV
jgi:hypothetical protein